MKDLLAAQADYYARAEHLYGDWLKATAHSQAQVLAALKEQQDTESSSEEDSEEEATVQLQQ